jgi:hypothetical protein
LVSVVDPSVGPGPVNIVAEGMDFLDASELRVEPAGIVLDRVRVGFDDGGVYRSRIDLAGTDRGALRWNLPALKETLLERSSPRSLVFLIDPSRLESLRPGFERALAGHLAEGVRRILGGDMTPGPAGGAKGGPPTAQTAREDGGSPERQDPRGRIRCHGSGNATVAYGMSGRAGGVRMIAGCGFGLTPSGDDFICGMLVGLHVAGQVCGTDLSSIIETIYRAAETRNFLSQTFLSLACDGCVDARLKALLEALGWDDRTMTGECARSVISVGETSGADMLTGLYMTLEKCA